PSRSDHRVAAVSATTGLVSVPIPAYVHEIRSPAFRYTGGMRAEPTPAGVPVAMTSPVRSVRMFDAYATCSNTSWIIKELDPSCTRVPFRSTVIGTFLTSATNSFGVMKGPSGANVSCDFPTTQSDP